MAPLETIVGQVFSRTLDTLLKPTTPVNNSQAQEVAEKVTAAVKPVLENATNSEPFYRSRIYIGLIVAGLGAIAQHFGVSVSGSDIELITASIPELMQAIGSLAEVLGLLYAAYGRIVGSSKAPLGK